MSVSYDQLLLDIRSLDPALADRFDGAWGDIQATTEDRVLRMVGKLCLEYEEPNLFVTIYRQLLSACDVQPDDALGFLRGDAG